MPGVRKKALFVVCVLIISGVCLYRVSHTLHFHPCHKSAYDSRGDVWNPLSGLKTGKYIFRNNTE